MEGSENRFIAQRRKVSQVRIRYKNVILCALSVLARESLLKPALLKPVKHPVNNHTRH